MDNKKISEALYQLADLLDSQQENIYRIRAYRKAAGAVQKYPKDIVQMVKDGKDLTAIPNVGSAIASKIVSLVQTNKLPEFKSKPNSPYRVSELNQVVGLGKTRIKILREQFNITTLNELQRLLINNGLDDVKGFGRKVAVKILNNLAKPKKVTRNLKIYYAIPNVEPLIEYIQKIPYVTEVEAASSYRRRKELINTVDILISTKNKKSPFEDIFKFNFIREIVKESSEEVTIRLYSGLEIILHWVKSELMPLALLYYTGSDEHYANLVALAKKQQANLSSVEFTKKKLKLESNSEAAIYKHLGLAYIEPELRENRGEIAAAQNKQLPQLITLEDIKGNLHCHTYETDGVEDIETLARAADELGYEYLAITDHSQSLKIANGLDKKRLFAQLKLIDKINAKLKRLTLLKSSEIDILVDGSLDFPNSVLKELDERVCSVHSKFRMSEAEQTERILRAMDNPYFNILGHATGRLMTSRPPYAIDMPKILQAAKERNCFLELNCQPARLDINDIYCKMAKEAGVKVAISTDAHTLRGFGFMQLGINQARRGWLEAKDVINTRKLPDLLKLLKRN